MRKAIAATLLMLAGLMLNTAAYGQSDKDDLEDDVSTEQFLSSAERAELLARLDRAPSADMSPSQLWDFYRDQDTAARRLGDIARELELLPKWLEAAGSDLQRQLQPLWRLWQANMAGGDVSVGIKYGNDLLALVPGNAYPLYRLRLLGALARDHIDLMDLAKAEKLLRQAQAELRQDDGKRRPANKPARVYKRLFSETFILSAQARLHARQGKYADAEGIARQALEIADQARQLARQLDENARDGANRRYLTALDDLMRMQVAQNHLIDASATAQTLLRFLRDNGFGGADLNGAYMRIAELKLAQSDLRRAEFYARAALKNAQAGNSQAAGRPTISAFHRLIDVHIARRAWADALLLQTQLDNSVAGNETAQKLARRDLPRGLILAYSGRAQEAQAFLKKSTEHHVRLYGERHIATVHANGLYAIALAKSGQADAAAPLFATTVRALHARDMVGGNAVEQGLYRTFRQLILEEYIALLSDRASDASAVDEAFRVLEYLRGSVVQQSVVDAAVRAAAGVAGLADLVRVEQDARQEMAALQAFLMRQLAEPPQRQLPDVVEQMRKRIASLQADIASHHRAITQRFPEYDALIHPQPPSVAAVAKRLRTDEALISIFPLPTQVVIVAVSSQGASLARVRMTSEQLDTLVRRMRKSLDIGDFPPASAPAFDAGTAYQLYETLLAPAAPVWKGKSQLTISAGGSLGQIPFGALMTSPVRQGVKVDDAVLSKAAWLVTQASVSHVPSVSSWAALRDVVQANHGAAAQKPFFGFGDPLFNSTQSAKPGAVRKMAAGLPGDEGELISVAQYDRLPPLPETRDEIVAIASALGADPNRDSLFGKEATRKNVLAADLRDRRVIAFATHGLVAGELPNLSQPALAMAATGSDKESPLLTLEDVLNLKLNADWVVLSACNTAAADGQAGEAISGLGRGFFYAGAKALLVTHWAVESESAKDLTIETFKRFGADATISRAEALRQAQLTLIAGKRYAHPFFWAPYALVGDGGR